MPCYVEAIGLPNCRESSAFVVLVGPALLLRALTPSLRLSLAAMRRLWLYGIYAAAALLENDTRPLCRDVRIHDDPKKREGYGNQIHALVFAAEFARSCGLRVAIPRTGRFGVICSRLGCKAPHVDRRDFGEKPEADFEATYVGGAGARCATKRTRDCRLADPRCIPRANEISQIKSDALRNILDIHHPARNRT